MTLICKVAKRYTSPFIKLMQSPLKANCELLEVDQFESSDKTLTFYSENERYNYGNVIVAKVKTICFRTKVEI